MLNARKAKIKPPTLRDGHGSRQVEVDGRELKLTNLDKVLYPETGFSKGEVVDYYAKVAPAIVPAPAGPGADTEALPRRR